MPSVCAELRLTYHDGASGTPPTEVLCNEVRIGQMRSLDRVHSHVRTRFIFHLEDDWEFDGQGGFIEASIDVLNANTDCFQVHVRAREKSQHPAHSTLFHTSGEHGSVAYRRLVMGWYASHQSLMWHGFSLGPGLRRLAHIRALGSMEALGSELGAQARFKRLGLWSAALEHGVVEHIGDDVSRRREWEVASSAATTGVGL
jgi:hypothetical protein